ncbi:MAG: hypothetical protein R6V11_04050 [Ectothiorhodospiraceae bacterium]
MAKLPVPQERVVFSGANFSQRRAGRGGGLPLANALQQFAANKREQLNEEALVRVQNAAVEAQREAGIGEVVAAPEDTTGVFRQAFEEQARSVFSANLSLEANRRASEFAREHPADPEAFAEKFDAFMGPQVEALRESDARAAFEVEQRLNDLGLRHQNRLAERAAGQAQEAERSQVFSDLESLSAELQDNLLRDPDIESLEAGEAELAERLAQARESGLISASQEINERERANATLRTEYARGRFNNALEAGDIGGARGVITMLRDGGLFDDNATGRTLADRLAREFDAATEEARAVSSEQLSEARKTANLALDLETDRSNPQFRNALDTLTLGDEGDRALANRISTTLDVREQFGPRINQMNTAEVSAEIEKVRNRPGELDPEEARAMVGELEARQQELADVAASGNALNAQNVQLGATPQQIQRARAASARAFNMPLDEVPLVNDQIVSQTAARLERAQRAGDAGSAVQVIEQMMVPAQDIHDRQNIALTAGEPELAGFAAMAALAPDTAEDLFNLSFQGANTTQQARDRALNDVEGARDLVFETAERLSGGRPAVRDSLEVSLTNALTSLVNDFEARGTDLQLFGSGVMREFRSLLEPFEQEVELANGARVPAGTISQPEVETLNNALSDPGEIERRFGEAMVGDPATLASLTPYPLPGGQWAFQSSRTGSLAEDDEGEIIKLNATEAVEAAAERQLTEGSSVLGRIFEGRTPTQQALEVDIPNVARATSGGDARMLEAVFKAGLKVPSNEKLGREFTMLWAEENVNELDDAAYEKAWREAATPEQRGFVDRPGPLGTADLNDPPDPTRDPLGGKIAASLLMDQFAARFGDGDKALAAYFVGADVIEAAGDDWRKAVPDDVFMFIERVKEEL